MAHDFDRIALERLIESILTDRYRKSLHYQASGPGGKRRYGVCTGPKGPGCKLIIEPCTHAEAESARMSLIVSDLADLVESDRRDIAQPDASCDVQQNAASSDWS